MKKNEQIINFCRIFLGVFLIGYALNQFFHFLPTGYGAMPELAQRFIDSVVLYLPFLYAFEILIGIFLIFNKWSAFLLIVLFPLTIAFLFFTYVNGDITEMWSALVVAILNIVLVYFYRERYLPLFD